MTKILDKSGAIIGYTVIKQVIRGRGTEISSEWHHYNYADNVKIAKLLLTTAAENCLDTFYKYIFVVSKSEYRITHVALVSSTVCDVYYMHVSTYVAAFELRMS